MAATERTCRVTRNKSAVDDARRFAELAVAYCDVDCRQAVAMVVSEFAENLVKYSAKDDQVYAGTISILREGGVVRIRAKNAVASPDEGRRVQEAITRIATSPSITELYRSRLQELFKNPQLPRAQLGLLRIAFEGGFRLSCSFEASVLEITAERACLTQ
jgi:hypothetical protein